MRLPSSSRPWEPRIADTARVENEPFPPPEHDEPYLEPEPEGFIRPVGGFWALGGRLTWVAAIVLTVSAFTDWYAESGLGRADDRGDRLAHGHARQARLLHRARAARCSRILRELGFELPPSVPESLVVIALGSLATIFVLIRLISIPDSIPPPAGSGHRHLDQPGGVARRDRRRTSTSFRRAVASSTPRIAPPSTSSGQWTPTYTRENAIAAASRNAGTASCGEAHASTVAHANAIVACPDGNEPEPGT